MNRTQIEALIPHAGSMCLLEQVVSWNAVRIECIARSQRASDNPLRADNKLSSICGIEYAAQAMAVHGALCSRAGSASRAPGFLASARDVRLACWRLDDLPPASCDELVLTSERQAADATRILCSFRLHHAGRELASGRVAVVLDATLAAAP